MSYVFRSVGPRLQLKKKVSPILLEQGSMYENFSLIRRLSQIGTFFQVLVSAVHVGEDVFGNRYYQEKNPSKDAPHARRWVLYKGEPDASKVPAEWHIWLHYTQDQSIKADSPFRQSWQKPHHANLSGTPDAYLPTWHALGHDKKINPEPFYRAWKP